MQPLSSMLGLEYSTTVAAIAVTVGLLLVLLLWQSRRRMNRLQQQLARVQHDLLVANSSAIGMGQQLLALEKKGQVSRKKSVPLAAEKPVKLTVVDTPVHPSAHTYSSMPSNEIYETSRQLLAEGVDIEEVIKRSGLSYSEVSLMKSLVR